MYVCIFMFLCNPCVCLCFSQEQLTVFLHPHYGVGNEHFHNTGHALFLALG